MSKILIISDGKPGHENQSIALAKLKNLEYDITTINNRYKTLAYILDFFRIYLNLFSVHVKENYTAIVSTGSSTYYTNKYLAKKLNVNSIAIMLPKGFRYSDFDYIIAQSHDNPPKKENIIELPINLSISEPKGFIKKSDKKAVGIIIGGGNKIFSIDASLLDDKLDTIFKNYPHHLKYVTTSRRTPKYIDELLKKYNFDYKVIYSKNPDINPIPDFLKVCDTLYITIDSTSMLSEAKANSNASLHIIDLPAKKNSTKYHKLTKNIKKLDGKFDFTPYLEKVKL